MSGPSIIVEPRKMFFTLHELQQQTSYMNILIHDLASILQKVSSLTYAIGFGELMKKAELELNRGGSGMVAATNAINTACKEVINLMVAKFASEGAKSDYTAPKFTDVHIKINTADRVAIYPSEMLNIFWDLRWKMKEIKRSYNYIVDIYQLSEKFWVGASADRIRKNFDTKVTPHFEAFFEAVFDIYDKGIAWIEEANKFDASLGVQ